MNDNFLGAEFTPLAAIATTPTAAKRLLPLCQTPGVTLWVSASCREALQNGSVSQPRIQFYSGSLKELLAEIWRSHRAFIFCLATGATVRLIAPLLADKSRDPAVVVLDEAAQYVISLCSGHIGGADQLARLIATQTGATPILTGAANALQLPGIDVLGVPFGWQRGPGDWTGVSGAIARGETVQVLQEVGTTLWQQHLPPNHPFNIGFSEYPDSDIDDAASVKARIWISYQARRFAPNSQIPKVQWHPRVLWVGIGCERGVSAQLIETAIMRVFQAYHLALEAVAGIATIDIKASEDGLVELCRDRHWPLHTFPSENLRQVAVPTPSTVVETEVGTPSVAEAAAKLAANAPSLLVAKKIYREEGEPGAVTVAVAVAEREYTGRRGKLLLVGTGPGDVAQITGAAQGAIVTADAIIGYTLYTNLIAPLLHPGQIIESLPITQEKQRAERAIELAKWGLTVAVISSGDAGIYGMAGLVLEQLRAQNWDGQTPAVQVFPGISAIQAAAARVGAPLMHDFCAISLSDLLTPWPVIEKRLEAAAMADFITGIYNPRSQTRTEQIVKARDIFLKYRSGNTPVAIVRDAYREDEQITLTNLDNMLDIPIDMLSIVIIGNQSTVIYGNWMITPRGYLGFA